MFTSIRLKIPYLLVEEVYLNSDLNTGIKFLFSLCASGWKKERLFALILSVVKLSFSYTVNTELVVVAVAVGSHLLGSLHLSS